MCDKDRCYGKKKPEQQFMKKNNVHQRDPSFDNFIKKTARTGGAYFYELAYFPDFAVISALKSMFIKIHISGTHLLVNNTTRYHV